MEISVECTVRQQGGSLRLSLPKFWVEARHLAHGDLVLVTVDENGRLRVVPKPDGQSQK